MFLPVIMAGGSGTRLWPLSRQLYPKQFLALTGERSMLQETVARLEGMDAQAPMILCNEEHRFIVAEQLRQMGQEEASILLEPVGRNTAPAIAWPRSSPRRRRTIRSCWSWQPTISSRTRRVSMQPSRQPRRSPKPAIW